MDGLSELRTWGPLIGGALAGVLPWLKLWADSRKTRERRDIADARQRVDLIRIAEEISAKSMARLQARVEALEAELTELRKEHADTIASKDAEIAMLRGELRQTWALADAYERKLTEAGVPHEKPNQPLWRIPAGDRPTEISAV